jgi:hypothetical protein
MRTLFCLVIIFFVEVGRTQSIDSLYKRTYSDDLDYLGLFDNNVLKQLHQSIKDQYLFFNSQNIDTCGIRIYTFPKYLNDTILIVGIDKKNIQTIYFLKNNCLLKISEGEIFQHGFSSNLIVLKNSAIIYLYNISEKSETEILNISERLKFRQKWLEDNQMTITDEFWIDNEKLFFSFASCPVSCSDYRHYLFNKTTLELKELKFLKSNKKSAIDEFTCFEMIDSNHKKLFGYTSHSLDSNIIGRWLFNDTLKRVTKLVSMNQSSMIEAPEGHFDYESPIIAGYDYQNKSLLGINYRSDLDNKFNVIVPYKFSIAQELAMLKVYYDSLLTQKEVSSFGKYELSVLRNLIFAKHNYKFESEFWQAYFNLFEFCRSDEKRKSRNREVEKLFTGVDRKNLELIKKAEKK